MNQHQSLSVIGSQAGELPDRRLGVM